MTTEEKCDPHVGSNMRLCMDLWPNAMWTPALQSFWRDQFSTLRDQSLLRDSILWVRPQFASHQPEVKWVISQYSKRWEALHPSYEATKQQQSQIWHVTWMQPARRDSSKLVEYGTICHSYEEAHATARQRNGRVIENADNSAEPTEADYQREECEARASISTFTRPELVALVGRIRAFGWLADKLPGSLEQWSRKALLMVYGGILHERTKTGTQA